jgi:hypothetical protein
MNRLLAALGLEISLAACAQPSALPLAPSRAALSFEPQTETAVTFTVWMTQAEIERAQMVVFTFYTPHGFWQTGIAEQKGLTTYAGCNLHQGSEYGCQWTMRFALRPWKLVVGRLWINGKSKGDTRFTNLPAESVYTFTLR